MAAILAVPAMADGDDEDSRPGRKSCSSHANLLFQACKADRRDDLLVHKADCLYVTPKEDQPWCLADAREESREKAEECRNVYQARLEVCDLVGEQRFDIEFDPEDFVDPDAIGDGVDPNPYFPLTAGHTSVIVGGGEVTVVTVTDEVREVGEEHVSGDVIYCGENTYEIEAGLIDNTDGSFANGTDRARAGYLVRAFPVVGEGDRQEMASDEAEDIVEYVSLSTTPADEEGGDVSNENIACDPNGGCLKTFELNPRDPGTAEYKYYLPGTGFVLAVKIDEDRNPIGEREEVTCVGDSLDVLDDKSCGIADPDALKAALCFWAPTLCTDE